MNDYAGVNDLADRGAAVAEEDLPKVKLVIIVHNQM